MDEERNDDTFKPATEEERDVLVAAGFFAWGRGSWIHKDDEGHVLTVSEALARIAKSR